MGQIGRTILISIKPEFVELIFNGQKTVELRKSLPKALPENAQIIIYASSPTKSIVGRAFVKSIESYEPQTLWEKLGHKTGITFDYFSDYFQGREKGYGIVLDRVEKFSAPLSLCFLRDKLDFTPPQSFMYAKEELMECIGY